MITIWQESARENAAGLKEYVLGPHVSLVLAHDGTARLLDMGGGFFALPAIGAEMLVGTLENGSAAAALEVAQRYQVNLGRVQADLAALLQQLQQRGLLRPGQQRRRDLGLWLAQVLVPCLCLVRSLSAGRARVALTLTLTKLALLCFGWARTVTVWQRHLRRCGPPDSGPVDERTVRSLDELVRQAAASHLLLMACKERALACWALLRWLGVPATLVVGLEFFPLIGHCWCEAGPWVLSDHEDNCELYTPVIRYD
jgi:hypothetical protein